MYYVQVLLFPAMKPEDQKAGALTSAAPPSAAQHPGPSSSKVQYFGTLGFLEAMVACECSQDQQLLSCSTASLLLLPLKLFICVYLFNCSSKQSNGAAVGYTDSLGACPLV